MCVVVVLALDELLAYHRHVVNVERALQMVALVLHYAGQKARDLALLGLEVLVDPLEQYVLGAGHLLAQSGQAEAPLLAGHLLAVEHGYAGIDQR